VAREVNYPDIRHASMFVLCSSQVNHSILSSTEKPRTKLDALQTTYPGISSLPMLDRGRAQRHRSRRIDCSMCQWVGANREGSCGVRI